MMRLSHTLALATVLAFAAACSNLESPTNPELGILGGGTNAITCNVSVTANTMNCDSPNPNARSGPNYSVSLGGQNSLVQLAATGSNFAAGPGTFTATGVTVKNLTVQPMGTANGTSADANGIRVFFYNGPNCTVGGGTATPSNTNGSAVFISTSQPYHQYAGNLAPNATSAPKDWTFTLAGGCTAFTFQVLVNSVLPQELGILKWDLVNAGTSVDLSGVATGGNGEVWAVGANGTIVHYNGTSWSTQASGHPNIAIRAIDMHGSPARGVAVGDSGRALFYNGTSWADAAPQGTAALLSVSKVGDEGTSREWWACGGGGAIFHTTDSSGAGSWSQVASPTGSDLHVCGGSAQNNVYALGAAGTIVHWGGSSWTASGYTSGTTKDLFSATGGNGFIYAGGADGTIISSPENPGTTFATMTSPVSTGVFLYGAESSDAGHPYFVGTGGTIVYLNDAGSTWLVMSSGTNQNLNDIAVSGGGTSQLQAWAVGNQGVILHGHR